MGSQFFSYSPCILIYLEIGEKRIRLADVANETAIVFERAEVPRNTRAVLVFSIDGREERQDVWMKEELTLDSRLAHISYTPTDIELDFEFPPALD